MSYYEKKNYEKSPTLAILDQNNISSEYSFIQNLGMDHDAYPEVSKVVLILFLHTLS